MLKLSGENQNALKINGNMKKIGFGYQFTYGLLFGIRHYEPSKKHIYYEIQLYWGLVVLFITIHKS